MLLSPDFDGRFLAVGRKSENVIELWKMSGIPNDLYILMENCRSSVFLQLATL